MRLRWSYEAAAIAGLLLATLAAVRLCFGAGAFNLETPWVYEAGDGRLGPCGLDDTGPDAGALDQGLDLGQPELPAVVSAVRGLSHAEPRGR